MEITITDKQVKILGKEIGSALGKELTKFFQDKMAKRSFEEMFLEVLHKEGLRHDSLAKGIYKSIVAGFQEIKSKQ